MPVPVPVPVLRVLDRVGQRDHGLAVSRKTGKGKLVGNRVPQRLRIEAEVPVRQDVAKTRDLSPLHFAGTPAPPAAAVDNRFPSAYEETVSSAGSRSGECGDAAIRDRLRDAVDLVARRIREHYGRRLTSVVLYGSVARGDFRPESDIDLLVVVEGEPGMGGLIEALRESRLCDLEVEWMKAGLPHSVQPVVITVEHLRAHPPLLLDLTTDAVVLFDRDGVFAREMDVLRSRMAALGSRKVVLPNGSWYWDLKPDSKFGEVVDL